MVGDFRSADYKPEVVKIKTNMISCRNCGSDTPGEGTKCIHCNFPFAQDQIQARKAAQDDSFQNLKVG
jgi:ribosomal protein L40E